MKVIHLLRKPCSEPTVAANVLRHGTGALNIDATRIGTVDDVPAVHATRKSDYPQSYKGDGAGWGRTRGGHAGDEVHWEPKGGRWPANLVLDGSSDEVVDLFPNVKAGVAVRHRSGGKNCHSDTDKPPMDDMGDGDSGSAARFFKQVGGATKTSTDG